MRVACLIGGLLAAGGGLAQVSSPPSVMIFFDWGKTTIGRDYGEALDASVVDYLKRPGRVIIESHSDRSGSAPSNLASSRLRANAVRNHLVARGVPASAMEVIARGEDRPLIPTADGVREPQNRRVEVRFGVR